MSPRTAHAHDIVTDTLWRGFGVDEEYWHALQTIIDAPDFGECDEEVKQAAYAAVRNEELNVSDSLHGPF
jgi:hypothetical protein